MRAKNPGMYVATTVLFLASALTSGALPEYEIIDLGTLGGGYSVAGEINNGGQVVGGSFTPSINWHAFLWDMTNGITDLGTLPGHTVSGAGDINDDGVIVGSSGTDTSQQAFIWDKSGGMRPLPGISESEKTGANGINNRGQVLGHTPHRAFLWDADSGVTYLGTLGGAYSGARAINNIGEVVGSSDTLLNKNHAFLWNAANGMRDLGTLGGPRSDAFGINDVGQVVGWSHAETGYFHAFLWDSVHGMTDLGLGTDTAHAINDAGQVVGVAAYNPDADDGEYYAFYWDSTVGVIRLYDLLLSGCGWADLKYALAINNRGQIVGEGITTIGDEEGIAEGENHAFLMTPALPTIKVSMRLTPEVLNCHSKGKFVKAHLVLPEELTVDDVDPNGLTVARPLGMEILHANIFVNNENSVEVEVALRRDDFCNALKGSWRVEEIITIRGSSTSGQYFYGMDAIRIIDSMLDHVSFLSSHWLEEYCGNPDWCDGTDLEEDGAVNFKDFAIMALHWCEDNN